MQLRESHMISTSDENAVMTKVLATHAPCGREFYVKHLLYIIEDIFRRATPCVPGFDLGIQAQLDVLDDKAFQDDFDMLDQLSVTISKISCEISSKCSGGGDADITTLGIFNILTSYEWGAKVVLALAAFALNYGEFWVVAQLYPSNSVAKSVPLLKKQPKILERVDSLKPKFDALSNLIKAMLDVSKCIVEFKELPAQYISPDTPEMSAATAHIPTAVYWTIRSILACASEILGIVGMGFQRFITSTTEASELSRLAHKVGSIHTHLKKQLNLCYQLIDEKRHIEAYKSLVRQIELPLMDNMKVLRALIYAKDDQLPLLDGATKRRANIEVLRRKNVLLLISDPDVSKEIFMLEQIYQESRQHPSRTESQYEVLWIPVVDRSTTRTQQKQEQFERLQNQMPWYSVYNHTVIDQAVIKYIKEVWQFKKKPMLVVLDPQGKVVNNNAIHMLLIWGSHAFPFTSAREEALWKEESWGLELLADSVDAAIPVWIADEKCICLYGGESIEWIKKFTAKAQAVAQDVKSPLEMLYVGKSNPNEKVRRNISTITVEKLSHTLNELAVSFFWVRLESMWYSKFQHGNSVENDPIMQEVVVMLSFDGSEQGWAVFYKGNVMARAKGETIVQNFLEFESWKSHVPERGFVHALNDRLREVHTPHHCNRLVLPGTVTLPEKVICSDCGLLMEKFVMFRCCND